MSLHFWQNYDFTSNGEVKSLSVSVLYLEKPIILHRGCKFELPQGGEEAHADLILLLPG